MSAKTPRILDRNPGWSCARCFVVVTFPRIPVVSAAFCWSHLAFACMSLSGGMVLPGEMEEEHDFSSQEEKQKRICKVA